MESEFKKNILEIFGDIFTMEEDQSYKEIHRLDKLLTVKGIPHEIERIFNGWIVYYPNRENRICDAIEHLFSYGNKSDLLEMMGLVDQENAVDGVRGYMTAKGVVDLIEQHWNQQKKCCLISSGTDRLGMNEYRCNSCGCVIHIDGDGYPKSCPGCTSWIVEST